MLTTEQLEERKLGIGGSDVADICGLSPWKTPLEVFLEKIGEREPPQLDDNPSIYWGNKMEPLLAEEFSLKTGLNVYECKKSFVHPEYTFMRANVDRLIEGDAGKDAFLEIKTAKSSQRKFWGEDGSSDIPTQYLLQVAHYCMVLDKTKAYVAVKIDSNDFRILEYIRDPQLEEKLIFIESKFWNEHVLKRIPPSAKTIEDIGLLVKDIKKDSCIVANDVVEGDWACMKNIVHEIKVLQSKYEKHKFNICLAMNDNEILMDAVNGKMASWKKQITNRFNMDKFKEENPELYKNYLKQTESRVFRIY